MVLALAVSSVLKLAAEIGGDLFPPSPEEPGDGTLIIGGDVRDKGLKPGMLVQPSVGTVRKLADATRSLALIPAD